MESTRKKWAVYSIRDKGLTKPIWVRIGIAFLNGDGSYNLILDATPLDGKLHMREWREDDRPGEGTAVAERRTRATNGALALEPEAAAF